MRIPPFVQEVLDRLLSAGYDAYLVGGAVRDALRGVPCGDYDIATSARPEQTMAALAPLRVLGTGLRYGTVTALLRGNAVEITTFRADSEYSDGRRPDAVRFADTIEEDLARRDFTINAIAWNPARGYVDPFGGAKDIADGLLRTVGEPGRRFGEDGLRIMRALRFAATLGYRIERATDGALRERSAMLGRIAAERRSSELCKLLCGVHAGAVARDYSELLRCAACGLPDWSGAERETVPRAIDAAVPDAGLRLALFLQPLCGEQAARCVRDMRLPARMAQETALLLDAGRQPPSGERDCLMLLRRYGEEQTLRLLEFLRARAMGEGGAADAALFAQAAEQIPALAASDKPYRLRDLAVSGRDLLALGLRPGAEVGAALEHLLDLVMAEKTENVREQLLARAKEDL